MVKLNANVLINDDALEADMLKIAAFGDNVVDCYADEGVMFPGGNSLNHAVHAQRFGATTSYIGAVSDDAAGRHIRTALIAEGVDVSRLRTLPGRTAFCVIGLRDGEREFLRADLGVSIIEPDEEDFAHIATCDAVHTGRSSHIDMHLPRFADLTALSFDFAVVRDRARIARMAPYCTLAAFSGGDLSEDEVLDLARFVKGNGAKWCLITRGNQGAVLAGPDGRVEAPAVHAGVTDTLGAGDTFIARTLVGLLSHEAPQDVLIAATQAAAVTCSHIGGFGHSAPLDIDESEAMSLEEIYALPGLSWG